MSPNVGAPPHLVSLRPPDCFEPPGNREERAAGSGPAKPQVDTWGILQNVPLDLVGGQNDRQIIALESAAAVGTPVDGPAGLEAMVRQRC